MPPVTSFQLPRTMTDKGGTPFHVRPYRPEDRAALDDMYVDFEPKRAAQGLPPEGDEKRRRWLDRTLEKGTHLVAEIDGAVRGHIMLMPIPGQKDGSVELANFLHQSVRNRGIGTALNVVAVELAKRLGYSRVWLSVEPTNRAALRSYQKAGFKYIPGSLAAAEIEMEVPLVT